MGSFESAGGAVTNRTMGVSGLNGERGDRKSSISSIKPDSARAVCFFKMSCSEGETDMPTYKVGGESTR